MSGDEKAHLTFTSSNGATVSVQSIREVTAAELLAERAAAEEKAASAPLDRKLHTKFFAYHLLKLPDAYDSLDTSRMTLLYFVLSALDVLGMVNETLTLQGREGIINWIYAQQVLPTDKDPDSVKKCGFRGGSFIGLPFGCLPAAQAEFPYDEAHIAMTYTALSVLRILGDDLSRVNKPAVLGALKHLQRPDGSFSSTASGTESDMRFVYCACVISALLLSELPPALPFTGAHAAAEQRSKGVPIPAQPKPAPADAPVPWLGLEKRFPFDVELTTKFIVESQAYDGAIGMGRDTEGHGGTTYTAVASLYLMNRLDALRDRPGLVRWCVLQQGHGFCGRPEKAQDTCYSFWIGATLKMLGAYHFTCPEGNRKFNMRCQTSHGGFGKLPGASPDLLHSYFGLCGLSLMGEPNLATLDVELGLTQRTARALTE